MSNSRLETMVVIILGLVNGRTVNLSRIASQFSGPARLASNYRRLQRFFQFVRLDEAWLARTLIGLLNLRAPFTLCLDRTHWKVGAKDINLLVLCIAARRMRIPILWSVLAAGSSSIADRKNLTTRYLTIFGAGSIDILFADREFVGNRWFEFLLANDIPFAVGAVPPALRKKASTHGSGDTSRRQQQRWVLACHRGGERHASSPMPSVAANRRDSCREWRR